MLFWPSNPSWAGKLQYTSTIIAMILFSVAIDLGLAVTYGIKLAQAPLDWYGAEHGYTKNSTLYFVFYPATMPAINLPLALLDLILFWKMRLRPAYALTEAILLLCGWAVQVAIWTQCELPAGIGYLGEQSCYQQRLSGSATGDYNGEPEGIPMGLTHAKATFGYLCLMLYVIYTSLAAAAVHKQRMEKKNLNHSHNSRKLSGSEGYEMNFV